MFKNTSIMEIFNDPGYEEERQNHDGYLVLDEKVLYSNMETRVELVEISKSLKPKKFSEEVIEAAIKGQKTWAATSLRSRIDTLHKIWAQLNNISRLLVKLKKDLSPFIDYFDFYSDIQYQTEECKILGPKGVILIILSDCSPLFAAATSAPAALAAGCSVIVVAPKRIETFLLLLEAIFLKASLPEGVFQVVTTPDEIDCSMVNNVSKVFLCGSYLLAQKLFRYTLVESFNFFCPNNTSAFILESADLNAAVDKIIAETWGKEDPVFAVSNIVVQESVYKEFFDKLKYKINQFVIENKHSLKFKDKIISEKVRKIISKALAEGASVEEATGWGEWHPTVTVNYQSQDTDDYVPILKLLLCRTAKEGVSLVNNCPYTLGTSVWSEISSQALEISSNLISPNVWINCHGAVDAGVPLQLSGVSGNCVLGGSDGILEYASFRVNDPIEGSQELQENEDEEEPNYKEILEHRKQSTSSQQAFTVWRHNKGRQLYLKQIANSVPAPDLSDIIHYYAHSRYMVSFSDGIPSKEFSLVKNKVPIGVILLIINTAKTDSKSIVSLITPALALGNAVMVVLKKEDASVQSLIKSFINILPQNLLNVVVGVKHGIHLASDPNIQAVWLYDETAVSKEFHEAIKQACAENLKRFWIVPKKVPISQQLFQKQCLQNKVVWLTKMDQFP